VACKQDVRIRMRFLAGALVAAILTVSAAAGPGKEFTVTIEGMQFHPEQLTVHRGDHIVWVNKDLFPHTATAARVFDSGSIAADGSWSYTAAKSGEYAYSCTFHPTMKGKITVQ